LLAQHYPTFVIGKNTGVETGKLLRRMGYDSKRTNSGTAFKVKRL